MAEKVGWWDVSEGSKYLMRHAKEHTILGAALGEIEAKKRKKSWEYTRILRSRRMFIAAKLSVAIG